MKISVFDVILDLNCMISLFYKGYFWMYFIQVFVYSIFTQIYKHIQPCFPLKTTLTKRVLYSSALFSTTCICWIYDQVNFKILSLLCLYSTQPWVKVGTHIFCSCVKLTTLRYVSEGKHIHLTMCEADNIQVNEWRKEHTF